jgi:formylglycine-generating enzyme required for sulfatase activity
VILILYADQAAPGLPFLHQLHRIVTSDPASEDTLGKLLHAADGTQATPGELWRYTAPYRGLAAMTESDSDFFFGREHETAAVIDALASAPDKFPILLGNSGVGKSSLAQAGVLAALLRQSFPRRAVNAGAWPQVFHDSRQWCFLTMRPGTEPLRALVEAFLSTWQYEATDPLRAQRETEWVETLLCGKLGARDLLDATERRYQELGHAKPSAFFLYIDQGEELYVRAEERQRRRFSEVIAQGVAEPRLKTLMSMRADFLGELQKDEPLYKIHQKIDVPPLREVELREIVSRPAQLLSAQFETAGLVDIITQRTAEDSVRDVGALPLLSYTLDDMWTKMVQRGDGVLRLPAQSFELGGVLVNRADAFLAAHPKSADELRRIFTLKLATLREGEEPTRRRALRSEFTDEQWRLVSELADHPYRLLVTATPEGGETYAEMAHEAIFRRWDKLRNWIAAEREFLAWRTGLEAARRAWQATPNNLKNDALLVGRALAQGKSWVADREADIPDADRGFIARSRKVARSRGLWRRTVITLPIVVLVPLLTVTAYLLYHTMGMFWDISTSALTAKAEQVLKPGDTFKECASCPEMVVVPTGSFMMGSPANEIGRTINEGPQHEVTIRRPFAVGEFEVTYEEWMACYAHMGCIRVPNLWSRRQWPVRSVSWNDAKQYVAWLAKVTGKPYRLLTEAEWEYVARANNLERFSFGDDESKLAQHAWYNHNSGGRPHQVGQEKPNAFGIYDTHGNVWEWVADCYKDDYNAAPTDGSAWTALDCGQRVYRGGSYLNSAGELRSAHRVGNTDDSRYDDLGLRVGRTLEGRP